jgi:hypothetical protein
MLLLATAASFAAVPAQAATFVNVGDSATVNFGGTVAGAASSLLLTLVNEIESTATFTFNYVLTNLSVAPSTQSRTVSFGFNDTRADTPTGSASQALFGSLVNDPNGFPQFDTNINFPDGLGDRESCIGAAGGNCVSGPNGATLGNTATGSFTLDYPGSATQLTLNNFVVRYQSTGLNANGSGTGTGTEVPTPPVPAVPEPSTWALLLLGFGAIGYAMRRRNERSGLATSRVRFAF